MKRIKKKSWNATKETGKQSLYNDFEEDCYNIWLGANMDVRWNILIELNWRSKIWEMPDNKYEIWLNYNSNDFLRDTNFSISLIDAEKNEVCIIWMRFLPEGVVEFFQIQWKRKKNIDIDTIWKLITHISWYLKRLWFKKIVVLRAEANYYFKTPIIVPSQVTTDKEMTEWLDIHRQRMRMMYNVSPIRKWWFKKVTWDNKRLFSAELNL